MKTKSLFLLVCLMGASILFAQQKNDTVLIMNQKQVHIIDSADQITVKVFKMDTTELHQVYEGIFADDKSVESYSVESRFNFDFPLLKKRKTGSVEGHFDGLYFGKMLTTNEFSDYNDAGGVKIANSNEISLNPFEFTLNVVRGYVGLTTGLGMTWRNLHLANNMHLVNSNDNVVALPAPVGITYYYCRLRTFDLNMPFYLELQPTGKSDFYISCGVLFGVNTFSSYKVKYKNEQNNKVKLVEGKDYNVNPFSVSYVAQIGWDDWGVYAKYTPTGFFKEGKGPEIQTFSLGIQFGF